MRIALSGSAGTGKTTLARRLAAELGVPYVEEGMRRRLAAGLDLHTLAPGDFAGLLEELWEEQRGIEDAAPEGFVADRSSLDFAAFWLHYGLFLEPERTERYLAAMRARAQRYDRILLLPWGDLPLEHDGVRSTNPWVQLRVQGILEAVLTRFAPAGRVLHLPAGLDVEGRLAHVRAGLR